MTKGLRFDFGRNWQQFSAAKLNTQRLEDAALSLIDSLGDDTIQGRTFLDVGCGSGLFSIAAAQCGASQVVGFDVNATAVETSRQNAERFSDDLKTAVIPQFVFGDILDQGFIKTLGTFDVVYAWGSLHHTGRMWQAVRNAASLVDPANGFLVIAIYNRHWTSPIWKLIKRLYNSSSTVVRTLLNYVFAVIIYLGIWLTTGQNPRHKERGMDFWFDVLDWLGGYPYEYASIAEVTNFMTALGFQCERIRRPRGWTGCNEFVLRRISSPHDALFDRASQNLRNLNRGFADGDTRIKIAYVIDNLNRDGTQAALAYLVDGLAAHGYEQRVYCLNNKTHSEIVQFLTVTDVRVTVMGKVQLITLAGLVRLLFDFIRWRPLIVQTFLPYSDTIGRLLARVANVPVVVTSIRARNIEKRWWQFMLDKLTIRWADKVVFNNRQAIPFAIMNEGVHPDQVVHIPNGVKIAPINDPLIALRLRTQLEIPSCSKVIGTVGRLELQKGHKYLLCAMAQVLQQEPDCVLLVVGRGSQLAALEALAKELRLAVGHNVLFLGERTDVPELLGVMDVYVQASLYEGMPNAVMEAMASQCLVVATNVDGIRELITDGRTGLLVKPADSQALAQQIVYALQHQDEARRIGAAAAQRVLAEFSVDRMVVAFDALYRELLADSGYAARKPKSILPAKSL